MNVHHYKIYISVGEQRKSLFASIKFHTYGASPTVPDKNAMARSNFLNLPKLVNFNRSK